MKKIRRFAMSFAAALVFGLFAAVVVPADVQANTLPTPYISLFGGEVLNWEVVGAPQGAIIVIYSDGASIFSSTLLSSGMTLPGWNIPGEGPRALTARIITLDGQVGPLSNTINWTWATDTGRLTLPTNLRVDGNNILRWNSVPGADSYTFSAFWGNNFEGGFTFGSLVNFHDLSFLNAHDILPGQTVRISVSASAPDIGDSVSNIIYWRFPGAIQTPQITWRVDVHSSWASSPGSGNFRPGDVVTINAGQRPNHFFLGWTTSHNIWLSNPFSPTTTFTMPQSNVQVTAMWVHVDNWTGWDRPDGTWPDWWWQHWPDGNIPDWWWQQWPDGQIPDWWWQQNWPDGQVPDWWWSSWRPPNWQLPNMRPTAGLNWQIQHRGGVSFGYGAGNFPETLAVNHGSTVNLQLRVERHLAAFGANFVGQWLRNGSAHGNTFPITLSSAGFADIDLRVASVTPSTAGNYTLRVATIVNGVTTHVDTSRVAALSISGQGQATIWPAQPELPPLPTVNPMPTPRPDLAFAPYPQFAPNMAALVASPAHNHSLVMGSPDEGSAVLQILPGTSEVRLYGMTLDAMINSHTTLFVVNDLVWTVMPPEFLAHLRERGGIHIGPNGGTFNIAIGETTAVQRWSRHKLTSPQP